MAIRRETDKDIALKRDSLKRDVSSTARAYKTPATRMEMDSDGFGCEMREILAPFPVCEEDSGNAAVVFAVLQADDACGPDHVDVDAGAVSAQPSATTRRCSAA